LALSLATGGLAPTAAADPAGRLDVVLDSTQQWRGTNDVLFSVYSVPGGRSLADDGAVVSVTLTAPDGAELAVVPAIERFATYGRRLYRARVPLAETGSWDMAVTADLDRSRYSGTTSLEVWDDRGTPRLGERVPGGETPTMRDALSLMHHISSDPAPLTAFYTWSLDEAIAQGQPTVFVLDSYAFRPNTACGGALGILHEVFIDYPGLTVVHAEPWHMAMSSDGQRLGLDPPGGPAVLTDTALAWGIEEPPWVFVIDRDGRLQAKFTGVIGSDELRAAIASVTPWRPVGG
jgi:hypothetical protein